MFFIRRVEDVYVVKEVDKLKIPRYIKDIGEFQRTLELVFFWKKHCLQLQRILVPAAAKKAEEERMAKVLTTKCIPKRQPSPHTFFTPTKRRRRPECADDADNADNDGIDD